jgi:hypothetical protein
MTRMQLAGGVLVYQVYAAQIGEDATISLVSTFLLVEGRRNCHNGAS